MHLTDLSQNSPAFPKHGGNINAPVLVVRSVIPECPVSGVRADIIQGVVECLLIAISGHSDTSKRIRPLGVYKAKAFCILGAVVCGHYDAETYFYP